MEHSTHDKTKNSKKIYFIMLNEVQNKTLRKLKTKDHENANK